MIYGFELKNNVVCVPEEEKFIDYDDDFFNYHNEGWIIKDENIGEELGQVFLREKRPLPELIGGQYQLEVLAQGGDEFISLYQKYDTQQNRKDVLDKLATYMKEH